ncbi:hypothetical protein RSAG8_07333, partial [Rhizoctonia solani AG-8 WAC10335]
MHDSYAFDTRLAPNNGPRTLSISRVGQNYRPTHSSPRTSSPSRIPQHQPSPG